MSLSYHVSNKCSDLQRQPETLVIGSALCKFHPRDCYGLTIFSTLSASSPYGGLGVYNLRTASSINVPEEPTGS